MLEYEILNYLNKNYSETNLELLDYFLEKYPAPSKDLLLHIRATLTNLNIREEFIKISSNEYVGLGEMSQHFIHNEPMQFNILTFEDLKSIKQRLMLPFILGAKITLAGSKELQRLELHEQLIKVNQSLIDTNTSISGLNQKTKEFYIIQKYLTYAIAGAAIASTLFAGIALFNSRKTNGQQQERIQPSMQMKVIQLDSTLQSQIKIDSSFRRAVKDSLKMP